MSSLKRHLRKLRSAIASSKGKGLADCLVQKLDESRLLSKLGKRITALGEARISVDELLDLSQRLEPSLLFGVGGILFDYFFLSQGSITCRDRFNQLLATDDQNQVSASLGQALFC